MNADGIYDATIMRTSTWQDVFEETWSCIWFGGIAKTVGQYFNLSKRNDLSNLVEIMKMTESDNLKALEGKRIRIIVDGETVIGIMHPTKKVLVMFR